MQRFRLEFNGPEFTHLSQLSHQMRLRGSNPQPEDLPRVYEGLDHNIQAMIDLAILKAYIGAAEMLESYLREATIDQDLLTQLLNT